MFTSNIMTNQTGLLFEPARYRARPFQTRHQIIRSASAHHHFSRNSTFRYGSMNAGTTCAAGSDVTCIFVNIGSITAMF